MDGTSENFLAGSGLAGEENRRPGALCAPHEIERGLHGGTEIEEGFLGERRGTSRRAPGEVGLRQSEASFENRDA